MAMMNTPAPSITLATWANSVSKSTFHKYQSGRGLAVRLAGADVLVEVEDVGRVVRRLERGQPGQLRRRVRAVDRVVVERVHVDPARVRRHARRVLANHGPPGLILGRVVPAGRGDELEQRVSV